MKNLYNRFQWLLVVVLVALLAACNNDGDGDDMGGNGADSVGLDLSEGVLIINEGNFTQANGEISFYSFDSMAVFNRLFNAANAPTVLSAVIQDVHIDNNRAYIVDTKGGKVEVVNAQTLESVGAVTQGLTNPRYMVTVNGKGYVSCWGPFDADFNNPDSYIAVIDLATLTVETTIETPDRPEHLLVNNNLVLATCTVNGTLIGVNPANNTIEQTVNLFLGASGMVLDAPSNSLWVVATFGALQQVNLNDYEVVQTIQLTGLAPSGRIVQHEGSRTAYFSTSVFNADFTETSNSIYTVDLAAGTASTQPFLSGTNWGGLGVDEETNALWIGDNRAFQTDGAVNIYNINGGSLRETLEVGGIGPNQFIFNE